MLSQGSRCVFRSHPSHPVPARRQADAARRSASVPGDKQEAPKISSQTSWAAGLAWIRQTWAWGLLWCQNKRGPTPTESHLASPGALIMEPPGNPYGSRDGNGLYYLNGITESKHLQFHLVFFGSLIWSFCPTSLWKGPLLSLYGNPWCIHSLITLSRPLSPISFHTRSHCPASPRHKLGKHLPRLPLGVVLEDKLGPP